MCFDFDPNLKELDSNNFESNDFQQESKDDSNLLHQEELINKEENINERQQSFIFSSQGDEAYFENQKKIPTFMNEGEKDCYSIEENIKALYFFKSKDNIEGCEKKFTKKSSDSLKLSDCNGLSDKNLKNLNPIDKKKYSTQNKEIEEIKNTKNIIKKEKLNTIEKKTDNKITKKPNTVNYRKKLKFKVFNYFNGIKQIEINLKYTTKDIKRFLNSSKKRKNKLLFYIKEENSKDNKKNKTRIKGSDNIRKKIKSHFFKYVIKELNKKLNCANSKEKFKFKFQQCFIKHISKKGRNSKIILNMTLKELITTDFNIMFAKYLKKKTTTDNEIYEKNMEILKYLEENRLIKEKINFDFYSKMTYEDLFNEFLESREFVDDINKLKRQNYSEEYIKDYIIIAHKFIDYYSN